MPAVSAKFKQPAAGEGSAFMALIGDPISDVLYEHYERVEGIPATDKAGKCC